MQKIYLLLETTHLRKIINKILFIRGLFGNILKNNMLRCKCGVQLDVRLQYMLIQDEISGLPFFSCSSRVRAA